MQNSVYVSNTVKKVKWERIPSDRVNSVIIHFDFSEEWNGLLCVAQFSQGGKCYSPVIDENNSCFLPVELTKGYVKLGVFGTKEDGSAYRATTIPFEFSISESGFCSTAETPIPPTPDLFDQLINRFQKGYIADKIFNPLSEIAQSGIAVEQAKQQAITESKEYTNTKVGEIPQIEVDQTFNSLSTNAQSGVAVKEATKQAHVGEGPLSVQFYGKAEKYGSISIGVRSVCQQGNGVAIGTDSKAEGFSSGVAIGNGAKVTSSGCAAGRRATATDGGAVGLNAVTEQGGAVGVNTQSKYGFAGGASAKATAQHSIQLGTGTNAEEGTMCVSNGTTNYKLLEADGTIPPERLPEVGTTDYADLTNKPKINGVELVGDKTSVDLGLASAIKNTVSGSVVSVNDVAEVEHNVEVRVESKNIIDEQYVFLNTPSIVFAYNKNGLKLKKGTYTLSYQLFDLGVPSGLTVLEFSTNEILAYNYSRAELTFTLDKDYNVYFRMIYNPSGITQETEGKFQLEKGTTATPYTPYIPDLTQVQFSVTDKNGTKTYTPQADGTVNGVSVTGYDVTMQGEGIYTTATYNADTKRYIDNKFEELKKLNASTQALALGG